MGADCKSAGLRLRRFESYICHTMEVPGPQRKLQSGDFFGASYWEGLRICLEYPR